MSRERERERVIDGENGESTEGEDVVGAEEGKSETERLG